MTRFRYRPLSHLSKEVRLLLLLPSTNFSDAIECKILHSSLEEAPQYEALSYVWGNNNASEAIRINGKEITVRQNLLDALRHLRCDRERMLWVDAICIDQENILERNHQVGQMGSIYSSASNVVSWLGRASSDSELAIDFLKDMSSAALTQNGTPEQTVLPPCTKRRRKAVQRLMEREYWKRVWIVQEVVLARDIFIVCGKAGIYWEEFIFGVKRSIGECIAAHLDGQKLRRTAGQGVKLYDILTTCKDSLCSDPRDRVFAFLGIADDFQDGKLEADYSISTWDLWEQLVKFLLRGMTTPGTTDIQFFAHTILGAPMPPLHKLLTSIMIPYGVDASLCYGILQGTIYRVGDKMPLRPTDESSQTLSEPSVRVLDHSKTQNAAEKQAELKEVKINMFPVLDHGFQKTVRFKSIKSSQALLHRRSNNRQVEDPSDIVRLILYGRGKVGFSSHNVGVGDLVYRSSYEITGLKWDFGFIVRPIPQKNKQGLIVSLARFVS